MKTEISTIEGVLIDLHEKPAVKLAVHRGYNRMLCNHVYDGFCPNCPLHKCEKRCL